jgi:hypothetical protein
MRFIMFLRKKRPDSSNRREPGNAKVARGHCPLAMGRGAFSRLNPFLTNGPPCAFFAPAMTNVMRINHRLTAWQASLIVGRSCDPEHGNRGEAS